MKAYAISLPRFEQRYRHIAAQLARFPNLQGEIVGVDGYKLNLIKEYSTVNYLPGAVGCALSHIEAYKRMQNLNIKAALIVEDDVFLPSDTERMVAQIFDIIEPDEVISLYSRSIGTAYFSKLDAVRIGNRELLYPMDPKWMRTAAAYVIGRNAARKIAEGNQQVCYLADNWSAFYEECWVSKIRLLHPMPISLSAPESTIEGVDLTNYGFSLRRIVKSSPLLNALRQLRRRKILKSQEQDMIVVRQKSHMSTVHR